MDEQLTPKELRNAARNLEEQARAALASYSTIPIPRYSGNLMDFPRASLEDQAAEEGVVALREAVEQAVASLYTVAFAIEHGLQVPPALWIPIQPYIDAYLAYREEVRETSESAKEEKPDGGEEEPPQSSTGSDSK